MFGKGKGDQDPKKALEDASNVTNRGLMGGLTKAFMGQDFVDQTNSAISMGNQAIGSMEISKDLMEKGADATAEVLSITDTGATVNMNPVVVLVLRVKPSAGDEFQTAAQVVVPRISVPRVGDRVNIKYNPAIPSQVVLV